MTKRRTNEDRLKAVKRQRFNGGWTLNLLGEIISGGGYEIDRLVDRQDIAFEHHWCEGFVQAVLEIVEKLDS